jgi:hypothetical protein
LSLSEIGFGRELRRIGKEAFRNCKALSTIALPAITAISPYTFSGSGLTEITLPETVTEIGAFAFEFTRIEEITIPAAVATVAEGATTAQLLLGKLSEGAYVELLDGERNSVKRIELSQPNTKLDIPTGVAYLAIRNEGGVYEVVFK